MNQERSAYDRWIFANSDPSFKKYQCEECLIEFTADELDEDLVCEDCRKEANEKDA